MEGKVIYISDGTLHCVFYKPNSCDDIRVQILGPSSLWDSEQVP